LGVSAKPGFDLLQSASGSPDVTFDESRGKEKAMSAVGLESLDHTVQLTHVWINELDERLGWNNRPRAYRLLKAVLHALRDRLQLNEAADLAAQLPTLLRGVYYEQWRPGVSPGKHRTKADFLAQVEQSFKKDPLAHPRQAVMAVFELLSNKITAGEINDVRRALPEELRNLWPEPFARSA
jgi:uncharacterized protein (DUF2267 family)